MGCFKNLLMNVERLLQARTGLSYFLLVLFFILQHASNVFFLTAGFHYLIFPLGAEYTCQNVLFPGGHLNSELLTTVISPSNVFLIYPPGIYMLTHLLGDVQHMFMFLFVVQLAVPLLIFYLMCRIVPIIPAFFTAVVSIFYFVDVSRWAPDMIIQPLMIMAILFILKADQEKQINFLILAGIAAGFIMILKHNIGVVFFILVLTVLFFQSMSKAVPGLLARQLTWGIIVLHFLFGLLFARKVLYSDELVFYILPFFCFWAGVAGLLLKNSSWAVDVPRLIRSAGTFIACGMVLPVITFLVFGKVVGYGRYWHSLFGMGFEYLYIWDHGIWAQARAYLNNMLREKKLIVVALMYYFPLVVNGMSIVAMIRQYFPRSWGLEQTKEFLVIASMGIIGILLFFPLEGYHILSTKMFIFCFVGFYLIACFCDVWIKRFTPVFLILTVLFVGMFLMKPFKILKEDWTMGTDRIHRPIGLKMPLQLALELEKQAAVIERGVQGNPYYLLDGDGQTLSGILVFVNNLHTEYYFEMRPGIMNQSVVDEVLKAIRQLSYVVVNSENYRQYMAHESMDPLMKQILDYVSGYFTVVDEYEAPPKISSHTAMVLGFVVMKRN